MSKLKKCPFCGGEAQVNTWTMHGITESRCFCSNSDCPNSVRTVALEQWNNRPIEDALQARIIEVTHLYLQTKDAFNLVTEVLLKQDARIAELEEIDKLRSESVSTLNQANANNEDEIELLEKRIAELEAERRWRVVANGELPELGKEVIFYDSKMEGLLKGCLRKNGGAEWLSDEGYTFSSRDGRYSRITHWMPLPEPPIVYGKEREE